jgi:single-stranded-DNA-specific exonuclease
LLKNSKFFKACEELAREIKNIDHNSQIFIFSHYDADGLAAASIIAKTLFQEKYTFHLRIIERLEYDFLKKLSNTLPNKSNLIFSDLGTGVIEHFSQFKESHKIFILDHHSISSEIDLSENINFLNPHFYLIDGTTEISGAGVAYFVSIEINAKNRKLAPLALIGALGDRQDQGQYSALIGLNETIVGHAKDLDMVSDNVSLWFFDRSRSITQILQYSNIPSIENELDVRNLLEKIDIPIIKNQVHRSFYNLNEEECRRLASELIVRYGMDPNEIYKKDYKLKYEELQYLKDARVFATKLNACGRLKRPDVGISLCLGDRQTALRDLNLIEKEYSEIIKKSIQWALSKNNLKELEAIYFVDGREKISEAIIGTILSMISSMKHLHPKPILGCAVISSGKLKISMRTSRFQEGKIDLSEVLSNAIKALEPNSEVGGHAAAAGAVISESLLNDLVKNVNKLVLEVI